MRHLLLEVQEQVLLPEAGHPKPAPRPPARGQVGDVGLQVGAELGDHLHQARLQGGAAHRFIAGVGVNLVMELPGHLHRKGGSR